MPPEYAPTRRRAALGEVEVLEQGAAARSGVASGETGEPAHHREVLLAGLQRIQRGVLPGEADGPADLMPVLDHVESRDPDIAGIGPRQGREDPNRRGLAGSVGAEKGEDGAAVNLQVDAGENGVRAISLLESR